VTVAECRGTVDAIIQSRKSRRNPGGIPGSEASRKLSELPAECREVTRSTAWDLLRQFPQTDEGDFAAVLEALVLTEDPQVSELAVAAIQSPHAMVKEDYLSILEQFDRRAEALRALLSVLDEGVDQPNRPDLVTTIRALHAAQSHDALSRVARFVGHPDVGVRGSAITFIDQFDDSGRLGPATFAEQLARETNSDVLELLIDGLRRWGVQPDASILRRILGDDSLPGSLRESARAAMEMDEVEETGISDPAGGDD
jgi:hypothetical protein